jgi:hypothetical protein
MMFVSSLAGQAGGGDRNPVIEVRAQRGDGTVRVARKVVLLAEREPSPQSEDAYESEIEKRYTFRDLAAKAANKAGYEAITEASLTDNDSAASLYQSLTGLRAHITAIAGFSGRGSMYGGYRSSSTRELDPPAIQPNYAWMANRFGTPHIVLTKLQGGGRGRLSLQILVADVERAEIIYRQVVLLNRSKLSERKEQKILEDAFERMYTLKVAKEASSEDKKSSKGRDSNEEE